MATPASNTTTIPCAPELENVGTDRENQILNVMLATITSEPTRWSVISNAVGESVKIRKNGWGSVRQLLQWLMDNKFVARLPFDPKNLAVGESYVRLAR